VGDSCAFAHLTVLGLLEGRQTYYTLAALLLGFHGEGFLDQGLSVVVLALLPKAVDVVLGG